MVVVLVVLLGVEAALLLLGEVAELGRVPVGKAATPGGGQVVTPLLRGLDLDARGGDAGLHLLLDVRDGLGHDASPRPMASQQGKLSLPS